MLDGTLSPGDPVFYLHHSWLDLNWWKWQNLDLETRLTDMGGPNLPNVGGGGPGGKGEIFPIHLQYRRPYETKRQRLTDSLHIGPGGSSNSTAVAATPGVPSNPSGVVGGTGPEFTDYFGDGGNTTTLKHRIYMAEIYPNVTIADLMDLNGEVICSEYLDD
jgi:tyrosinase